MWTAGSTRQAFLICDAPGHGSDICEFGDSYPGGSPDGFKIQDQMKKFAQMDVNFSIIRVNRNVDKMIGVMKANYDSDARKLEVQDLEKAVLTKSNAEVTKDFVAKTSFIISKAVEAKTGKKGNKSAALKLEALWDEKKFECGQWCSSLAYYNVTAIDARKVTVRNSYGHELEVSKDILEKMHSAGHFEKEKPMNMTELAELLESMGDTCFTVNFRKKVDVNQVEDKLYSTSAKQLSDKNYLSKLAKDVIEGEECTLVCHLVNAEASLGRSTVIDLTTTSANKFRQVDHRTINYIIFSNCKYILKKGAKAKRGDEDDEDDHKKKKDEPLWDFKKLEVGDTFSGTSYFRTVSEAGDKVETKSQGVSITISKDVLNTQMYNASVFAKEEKVSLTNLACILEGANTACFTVCFNTKVDDAMVKEKLRQVKAADLKNKNKLREISKDLLIGKETVLVGRLSKAAGKMGRSLIIDLPTQGYRQVDHRTLKWLIIKNVKYTVK